MRSLAVVAMVWCVGCGTAGTQSKPTSTTRSAKALAGGPVDAAALERLSSTRQLALGRTQLVGLRAQVARVHARIGALRAVVQNRDGLADFAQLTCLEARVSDVNAFSGRGEHAYNAFRTAIYDDNLQRASLRLTSLQIAHRGVAKTISESKTCSTSAASAASATVSSDGRTGSRPSRPALGRR